MTLQTHFFPIISTNTFLCKKRVFEISSTNWTEIDVSVNMRLHFSQIIPLHSELWINWLSIQGREYLIIESNDQEIFYCSTMVLCSDDHEHSKWNSISAVPIFNYQINHHLEMIQCFFCKKQNVTLEKPDQRIRSTYGQSSEAPKNNN